MEKRKENTVKRPTRPVRPTRPRIEKIEPTPEQNHVLHTVIGSWGEPPRSSETSTYKFLLSRQPFPTLY